MAAQSPDNPRYLGNDNGRFLSLDNHRVDGQATFKAGQFCRIATDSLVYEGTTGTASGVGDDEVHLQAWENVDAVLTVDTTRKRFGVILQDDIFSINELDGAVTEVMKGQWYDMDVTNNLCTLNVGSASHAIFEVVNPKWLVEPLMNASADTLAVVYVSVLARTLDAVKSD